MQICIKSDLIISIKPEKTFIFFGWNLKELVIVIPRTLIDINRFLWYSMEILNGWKSLTDQFTNSWETSFWRILRMSKSTYTIRDAVADFCKASPVLPVVNIKSIWNGYYFQKSAFSGKQVHIVFLLKFWNMDFHEPNRSCRVQNISFSSPPFVSSSCLNSRTNEVKGTCTLKNG